MPNDSEQPNDATGSNEDSCYASFETSITIAKGCLDYGGGYRGTHDFDVYHSGIRLVIERLKLEGGKNVSDAIDIAKSCILECSTDVKRHGVQTVLNCLIAAKHRGSNDTQINAVFGMGKSVYKHA